MDASEAEAVDNLLRWLFRRADPAGAPVSDTRFAEAALMLSRHSRRTRAAGLGPEQIALPLGHLIEGRQLSSLPAIDPADPAPGIISPIGLLDGIATLAEAAERLGEYAYWIRGLVDAGFELESPISDGCGVYAARRPGGKPA